MGQLEGLIKYEANENMKQSLTLEKIQKLPKKRNRNVCNYDTERDIKT